MQTLSDTEVFRVAPRLPPRQIVHDLRNLFAIIGAAKSLLERDPSEARRRELLAALGEATRQGAQLTTDLLANRDGRSIPRVVDLDKRLADLAPMLRVLATARINVAVRAGDDRPLVRIVPAEYDAAILELASNAARAGASAVTIRGRKCDGRVWMLVSDNGCGMSGATLDRARRGHDLGLAHGTGLSRVQQFMATCHGKTRIRSSHNGGTTIALIFPVAAELPACAHDAGRSDDRRLIAA